MTTNGHEVARTKVSTISVITLWILAGTAEKGRAISVYTRLPIFHACVNVFGSPTRARTRDPRRCERGKTESSLPVTLLASSGPSNADPNRNTADQCQNH